jgi:hypothetical protein
MHISSVVHIRSPYIYSKSFKKASRRRERPWTILVGLVPPSSNIFVALALIGPSGHHHLLTPGLLLRYFLGLLLLPLGLLLLFLALICRASV